MLSEFEGLRNDIRHTRIIEKNYMLAISKCNSYLRLLTKIKGEKANTDKWFCYHDIALSNKKLNNFNAAIKAELMASNNTEGKNDFRYYSSLWMTAECNALLGNTLIALELYSECSKFYKYIEDDNLRICIIWNKTKIYKDVKAMIKIIKIYENKNLKKVIKTYGDFQYDDILTEMYKDLFSQYIESGRQQEAFMLIKALKDKSLRQELSRKLVA